MRGGLRQQITENQVCISLQLQLGQWGKIFTTLAVSLHSSDLLLAVLVYMQQQ